MDTPTSTGDKTMVDKFGVPKKIYYVLIANMVPALALCIAHGAVTSRVAPALGLIPAGFGAILAVYRSGVLHRLSKKPSGPEYQILLSANGDDGHKRSFFYEGIFFAIADFLIMSGLIITIVFSWLQDQITCHYNSWKYNGAYHSSRWCNASGAPMLAAYGTFPLLIAT
jgi:hypothetical protein